MQQRRSLSKAAAAFSLIELLVVIGVIAILIALLLAALSAARRQAATIKCQAALREVGHAFFLYAHDHNGYYPVAKWIIPPANRDPGSGVSALYWSDFIGRYVTRQRFNQSILHDPSRFPLSKQTVVWGCPNWEGISADLAPTFNINGVSVYENGFTMNIYPTYEVDYPTDPYAKLPSREWAAFDDVTGVNGQWYKQTQWTHPAQRALVVECTLWLLSFNPTNATHVIPPQRWDRGFGGDPRVGANQIDRYRHGRYPSPADGVYPDGKGRVMYNIAFADGHVETLQNIAAGYRAIRMRDP